MLFSKRARTLTHTYASAGNGLLFCISSIFAVIAAGLIVYRFISVFFFCILCLFFEHMSSCAKCNFSIRFLNIKFQFNQNTKEIDVIRMGKIWIVTFVVIVSQYGDVNPVFFFFFLNIDLCMRRSDCFYLCNLGIWAWKLQRKLLWFALKTHIPLLTQSIKPFSIRTFSF